MPAALVEVVDLTGAGGDERGQVPGVGVDQLAGGRVENGVDGGGERFGQQPGQGGVGPLQDLAGVGVVDRVGAEHAAHLPMIDAEPMLCPVTSPITSPTRLPSRGKASYQSPPTSAPSVAGR